MSDLLPGVPPVQEKSLREILDTLKNYTLVLLRGWKWLLIGIAVCTFLMYAWNYWFTPVKFNAKVTFMVSGDASKTSPMSSVLGLIGAGGGTGESPEKILELAESRKIISSALFKRGKVGDKEDFYANHIIRVMSYHKEWEDKAPELKGFFFKHGSIDSFNRMENKAMLYTFSQIVGNPEEGIIGYMASKFSEMSGIMTISFSTLNEDLSIGFLNTLFTELSDFYVTKTVEKELMTYNVISEKRDALHRQINGKERAAAQFNDQSFGVLFATPLVDGKLLQRDIRTLELIYGEAVKNAEMADFSLRTKTPFVQPIDLPIAPIKPGRPSMVMTIVLGVFLGLFFVGSWLIGRHVVREAYS
jgi:hypothetical protein